MHAITDSLQKLSVDCIDLISLGTAVDCNCQLLGGSGSHVSHLLTEVASIASGNN